MASDDSFPSPAAHLDDALVSIQHQVLRCRLVRFRGQRLPPLSAIGFLCDDARCGRELASQLGAAVQHRCFDGVHSWLSLPEPGAGLLVWVLLCTVHLLCATCEHTRCRRDLL